MKKVLLSLAALLLSVSASAQTFSVKPFEGQRHSLRSDAGQLRTLPAEAPTTPAKAPAKALASNQAYISRNLGEIGNYGVGFSNYGPCELKVGSRLTSDLIKPYAGCRLVGARFALLAAVGESTFEVTPIVSGSGYGDKVATATISSTQQGWNEVTFNDPYTLTGDETFLVSYSYYQVTDYVAEAYPIACSGTAEDNYGFLVYGNLGTAGTAWYSMGTTYGNVMIQLIVERDTPFESYDLSVDAVSCAKFVQTDGSTVTPISVTLHNTGNETINAATLDFLVDDVKKGSVSFTADDNFTLGNSKKTLTAQMAFPELEAGSHTLSVKAVQVMGADPVGNTADDIAQTTFTSFKQSKPHQKQLVEHFTSQYCTYCPQGYDMLNALAELRSDLAWVSIHDGYKDDEYTLYNNGGKTPDTTPITTLVDCQENPDAAFNRYYVDDAWMNQYSCIAIGIGFDSDYADYISELFSGYLDESNTNWPAFADMSIETSYDASTRNLNIKVYGNGVADVKTLMPQTNVTVYLSEDQLSGWQYNSDEQIMENYDHGNVLRKIVSAALGDPITWNGTSYEATYSVTLDEAWKAENMHVTAFLTPSKPVDERNAAVYQCETVKVGSSVDAINDLQQTVGAATIVARYNAAGQQIVAPQQGLNILKMSDGSIRKVILK